MDFKEKSYIFYLGIKLSNFELCNYFLMHKRVMLMEKIGIHNVPTELFLFYLKLIFKMTIGFFL